MKAILYHSDLVSQSSQEKDGAKKYVIPACQSADTGDGAEHSSWCHSGVEAACDAARERSCQDPHCIECHHRSVERFAAGSAPSG